MIPPALAARSCSRAACEAWDAGSCSWVVSDVAKAMADRRRFFAAAAAVTLKDENEGATDLDVEAALDVATPPRAAMRVAIVTSGTGTCERGAESALAGVKIGTF